MSNKNDIFDDLIKSQLEGFDANVSMADWDAIEAKLPATQRKKVAAYWWVTGLALLVVGVLTATYWDKFTTSDNKSEGIVLVDENQATQKESVVKNNYIPTPNEAPTEKTVNEPNQPENLNTEIITTTSSEVETKTSVQSTTGPDNLPTNIVDIKADDDRIKGAVDSAFSTEIADNSSNNDVDPVKKENPITTIIADTSKPGNTIDPIKPEVKPKWEIALSASPSWANKLISPNGDNAWRINREYENIAKTMESGSVSFQFEAKLNRYVTENIYFNTGINYNQVQERINYDYKVTEFPTEREAFKVLEYAPIHPSATIDVKYSGTNTYHYFEAPIRIGYITKIPGTQMNVRAETGLRYMVLADMSGQRTDVTRIDSLVDLKSALGDYNRHNLGATANVGLYWGIMKGKGDIGVTTYYNYALTSIRKRDEGITEKPYNFGLNVTLQRKILIK